jgi:hypothetical protein
MRSENEPSIFKEMPWKGPTFIFCVGLLLLRGLPTGNTSSILLGNGLIVGVVVWMFHRCRNSRDEVVRAANVAALAVGAPFVLGLALESLFVVRLVPQGFTFVGGLVPGVGDVNAVTAGFGMGVFFTIGVVTLNSIFAWIAWWIRKR